jgi:hypothetical protein
MIFMNGAEIIFEAEESPEGGFEARALGHAIFTEADSLDELRQMVRDAVRCHFDAEASPGSFAFTIHNSELITLHFLAPAPGSPVPPPSSLLLCALSTHHCPLSRPLTPRACTSSALEVCPFSQYPGYGPAQ